MLRFVLLLAILLVPAWSYAEGGPGSDKVLAMVDGQARWLSPDDISGFPGYILKLKAYRDGFLRTESELAMIKGYTATIANSRSRGGIRQPDGSIKQQTTLGLLMIAENPSARSGLSREEYHAQQYSRTSPVELSTFSTNVEPYLALLPKMQKFSFGELDVYIFSHDADSFELEIFENDFQGYELTPTAGLPVATLRGRTTPVYVGKYSGVINRSTEELYIEPPAPPRSGVVIDSEGKAHKWNEAGELVPFGKQD